jgi:hypothetical protein
MPRRLILEAENATWHIALCPVLYNSRWFVIHLIHLIPLTRGAQER